MKKMSRRNLLKSGTLLGVGAISAGPVAPDMKAVTSARDHQDGSGSSVRTLGSGKNAIEVNYGLGLGCMGMSFNRSYIPERNKSIALIRKAYDMGVNLFDTAEAYGPFTNEELVGEAISPFRKNITLCSKFGFDIQNGKMTGGLNSHRSTSKKL